MASLGKYLISIISRLANNVSSNEKAPFLDSVGTTSTDTGSSSYHRLSSRIAGHTPTPNLKGPAAECQLSLTQAPSTLPDIEHEISLTSGCSYACDISLVSDASTYSSSHSEDEHAILSLTTMQHEIPEADPFASPSPSRLIGLGFSGIPRRDKKPGDFDGLGVVGIHKTYLPTLNSGDHFEDDNNGYLSEAGNDLQGLSDIFMEQLALTLENDHTRLLATIPECEEEFEEEEEQNALEVSWNEKVVVSDTCSSSALLLASTSPDVARVGQSKQDLDSARVSPPKEDILNCRSPTTTTKVSIKARFKRSRSDSSDAASLSRKKAAKSLMWR